MLIPPLLVLSLVGTARAITIYGQVPIASLTNTAPIPTLTPNQTAAYDTTILTPPAIPQDGTVPAPTFNLAVAASNASVPNLSIMQHGSFYGFSVEMSVVTQLCECPPFRFMISSTPTLFRSQSAETRTSHHPYPLIGFLTPFTQHMDCTSRPQPHVPYREPRRRTPRSNGGKHPRIRLFCRSYSQLPCH